MIYPRKEAKAHGTGQMVEDVRLAVNGRVPVDFYGRSGGNVPSVEEILNRLPALARA